MRLKAFSVLAHDDRATGRRRRQDDLPYGHGLERLQYRRKVVHTIWLSLASFVCGWVVGQRGPSILELARAAHLTVRRSSTLFALGAGGYLLGCLASGVTFGRFHKLMSLFWSAIGMGATTIVLPLCSSYEVLAALYCFNFVFVGWLESGSCADVARLWGLLGIRVLQVLQLGYITGGAVSPVVSMIFLVDRSHEGDVIDRNDTSTIATLTTKGLEETISWNHSVDDFRQAHSNSQVSIEQLLRRPLSENGTVRNSLTSLGTRRVHYAYVISALLCLVAAAPFLVSYITREKQRPSTRRQREQGVTPHQCRPGQLQTVILTLTGIYFFLVSAVEESVHQFLFMYLVQGVGWSSYQAALATSLYWLSMGIVRLLDLFLPQALLKILLVLATSCCACALGGLHASVVMGSEAGVWSCVVLVGVSNSFIFPGSFSWLDSALLRVSGSVALVIMLASSVAGMVNPLVLGPLLQEHTYAWFVYLLTAEVTLSFPVLLVMYRIASISPINRLQQGRQIEKSTEEEV